jgi:hypothetical protein
LAGLPTRQVLDDQSLDSRAAEGEKGGKEIVGHASFSGEAGITRQCDDKSQVLAVRFNRRTAPLINQVQAGQPLSLDQQVKAAVTDGLRKTACNAKGDFRFEAMAPGFWYVWTQLRPVAPAARDIVGAATIGAAAVALPSAEAAPGESQTAWNKAELEKGKAGLGTGVLATFVVVSPEKAADIDLSADVVKLWPTWTETR